MTEQITPRPNSPRRTRRTRLLLPFALASCAGLLVASCSKSSTTSSTPRVNGLAGLGATLSNWDTVHGPSSSNGSAFGTSVVTGEGTRPKYRSVTQANGHIAGWVMAFPAGTTLLTAEREVRLDLPPDAQQTSSARETTAAGAATSCEVVTFQSVELAFAFRGKPPLGTGKFAVSFFDVQPNGTISTSYAKVNQAVVADPVPVPQPTCPPG
jgi:hypothetical protein